MSRETGTFLILSLLRREFPDCVFVGLPLVCVGARLEAEVEAVGGAALDGQGGEVHRLPEEADVGVGHRRSDRGRGGQLARRKKTVKREE